MRGNAESHIVIPFRVLKTSSNLAEINEHIFPSMQAALNEEFEFDFQTLGSKSDESLNCYHHNLWVLWFFCSFQDC